jgi:DNA-binding transcriptional ArsR family regulator
MSGNLAIISQTEAAGAVLNPVRRQVLQALRRPGSATSVGDDLGLARQKVNYHLRALEELGLVEHVEDRRRGNCTERIVRATASHYLIDSAVLGELEATPEVTADRFSSEHLAAVSARTVTEVGELRERAATAGKRLPTFSLETAIRFASPADQAAFVEGLSNAVAHLLSRYHEGSATGGRWFRLVIGSHPALDPASPAESDSPSSAKTPDTEALI